MRHLQTILNTSGILVLRQPSKPITSFDKVLHTLYLDMLGIMIQAKGVGIAAPQVGVNKQFCIVESIPMCNPQIIKAGSETEKSYEGCLSIPGKTFLIETPSFLTIEYQDLAGKVKTIELNGYSARVARHEIDHLQGLLIDERSKL